MGVSVVSLNAQEASLKVVGGGGWPGSTGHVVPIYLRNEDFMWGCRFNLLFDTNVLTVTNVRMGEWRNLSWSDIEGGIYVRMSTYDEAGLGPVANIIFNVAADASHGEYILTLADVEVPGGADSVVTEDGAFSVAHSVLTAKRGGGVPGGLERRVAVELKANRSAAGCGFDLFFDTDVLAVGGVLPTDYAQWEFDWNPIDGGIRFLKASGPMILSSVSGTICDIVLAAAEEAAYRDYGLAIDNVVVTDTVGNAEPAAGVNGIFSVAHGVYTIVNSGGFAGSQSSTVEVHLENDTRIAVIVFDLHFDTDNLTALDVESTERSDPCIGFQWQDVEGGIRLIAFDCHGGPKAAYPVDHVERIWPDTGSVAQVCFEITKEAPLGLYELRMSDVSLADPLGHSFSAVVENGAFAVVRQGDVNGDGDVNVADVILLISIILCSHEATLGELSAADCTNDDEVNVLDAVCIVNIILGG